MNDNMSRHEGRKWYDNARTTLAGLELISSAEGKSNLRCKLLIDEILEDYPMLEVGGRDYERRREKRNSIVRGNALNEQKRTQIVLSDFAKLFAMCRESASKNAPMLYNSLPIHCLIGADEVPYDHPAAGTYDGAQAWRMCVEVALHSEQSDEAKELYQTAFEISKRSKLADGCGHEEYVKRSMAFIYKILPNLSQPLSNEDAATHLIKMMPHNLRADGRRVIEEVRKTNRWHDFTSIAQQCQRLARGWFAPRKPRNSRKRSPTSRTSS